MKKVGINGFGRIGRLAARVILQKYAEQLDLAMINTSGSMDTAGWAHILQFDTVFRRFPGSVEVDGNNIIVNGKKIIVTGERDPEKVPWGDAGVEVVVESTGVFRDSEGMKKHMRDSVKKVILSAPTKDDAVKTVVMGVNTLEDAGQDMVSNASCTTNCVAPVTQVILDKFGIKKAAMTTIHSYTSDQNLQDGSHKKDLRRARAAAANIIPTSTGAAVATTKVIPQLKNKFDGIAVRVPTPTGSLTDFTFIVDKATNAEEVNAVLTEAAHSERLHNYLWVTTKPIVSSDVVGCEASALVDLSLTQVIDGDLVKIYAWYDNEWGYTNRLVEQLLD